MKYYDKANRRLVYIEESATPNFWDRHWNAENFKECIERAKNNRFVLKTLEKYIPDKKGNILEGGCGAWVWWFIVCKHMVMKA